MRAVSEEFIVCPKHKEGNVNNKVNAIAAFINLIYKCLQTVIRLVSDVFNLECKFSEKSVL
jgi:hypothetical protein